MLHPRPYYGALYITEYYFAHPSRWRNPPPYSQSSVDGVGEKTKGGFIHGFILLFLLGREMGWIWEERNQKKKKKKKMMMMMMKDGRKEILRRAILKYSTAYCYLIDRWGYPAKMRGILETHGFHMAPQNPGKSWTAYNRMWARRTKP